MLAGTSAVRPATLAEALAARHELGARGVPIAGGTDVMIELRRRPRPDAVLLDLSRVAELRGIRPHPDGLWLGAATTHEEAARSPVLREAARALAEACAEVGSTQIRNRGTLGGNVANASPCADAVTALVGLDALAEVASVRGGRVVAVEDLIERPYHAALEADELIVGFRVPVMPGRRSAFVKLGRRDALAISRINAACAVDLQDGVVTRCLLAVGSVMPRTERVREAEAEVAGRAPGVEAAERAAEVVAGRMVEIAGVRWSTPYKDPAVRAIVARAVAAAFEAAPCPQEA